MPPIAKLQGIFTPNIVPLDDRGEINEAELTAGMSAREILAIAFREKRNIILAALVPPVIAIGLWWNSNTIAHNEVTLAAREGLLNQSQIAFLLRRLDGTQLFDTL